MNSLDFEKAAMDAKLKYPISKLLDCDVTLDIRSFDGQGNFTEAKLMRMIFTGLDVKHCQLLAMLNKIPNDIF